MPPQLVIIQSAVTSGGVCIADKTLACTLVDTATRTIWIKTSEILPAGTTYTWQITGITNPRDTRPTSIFIITTFDQDGVSEIDSGFDMTTVMTELAKVTQFIVEPRN